MALTPGTRLGPYEIVAPLGAGGMGEVYRARDTRLGRDVAVKVLPSHTSSSPDVRARFEREARAVAALSHSNICALFDVGSDAGIDYLVMELLEGETLADRLVRGPLALDEVLKVGGQIADALDKAHRKGLVHRDLKPGNIMLTRGGAKLMDFGLARATGLEGTSGLTSSPTVTRPLTAEGTIVGTFHYMSPEQLEGREADARSDLWAFGATLYEMATGKRAFEGASQASLISSILRDMPRPITELVPVSPPALDRVVAQCLAKDPEDRWQSAGDLKRELAWIATGGAGPLANSSPALARTRKTAPLAWIVAGAALAAAAFAWFVPRHLPPAPALRAVVPAPSGAAFLFTGDNSGPPAVSPDGRRLAFVAVSPEFGARLWVRELTDLAAHSLPGTEGATQPFWSPDGRSLGFFAANKLRRIDLADGQVLALFGPTPGGKGGSWSGDGTILFCPDYHSDLFRISASGGAATRVTRRDTTVHSTHRWPQLLPDGRHFLYFAGNHQRPIGAENQVWFASLDGRENRALMSSLTNATYAAGQLFFVRDSVLFAQRFDPERGRLLGQPVPTRERVQCDPTTWRANFSVSPSGVLGYQPGGAREGSQLLLLDAAGKVLSTLGAAGNHLNLCIAKNGGSVVYSSQEIPSGDLFLYDLGRELRRRLTYGTDDDDSPVLSPAADRVAYTSRKGERGPQRYVLHVMSASGAGGDQVLVPDAHGDIWPFDWSGDGRWLLCGEGSYQQYAGADSVILREARSGGATLPFLTRRDQITSARFSPDDRWIAFSAATDQGQDVFVMPSPAAGGTTTGRWQVSSNGGSMPRWRHDGHVLYYIRADGMAIAVDVSASAAEFHIGRETELFRTVLRPQVDAWDVAPDGLRFVVNTLAGASSTQIVLLSDWRAELKRR